jgi:hypothetical protein
VHSPVSQFADLTGKGQIMSALSSWLGRFSEKRIAKNMLKARLRQYQVDPIFFSETCLDELVNTGLESMFRPSGRLTSSQYLTNFIDGTAVLVARICFGHEDSIPAKIRSDMTDGMPNTVWEILVKHDPARFSLKHLANTQSANKVLLETKKTYYR